MQNPLHTSSQKVVEFFARLDLALAFKPDDGERAVYLQNNAERVAKLQIQLCTHPETISATAWDLSEIADGIETRLIRLRAEIRTKLGLTLIQGGRS